MSYRPLRNPHYDDVNVRGLRYRLTWWGEPSATPIVLLHGFMDNGATWQFLVDKLPHGLSLVAPDWRGFGNSERAPGGYWFPDYLADLDALLGLLSPQTPARIIGHSMGANIAQMYAGIRPGRVAWLVNLEGLGLPDSRTHDAPARYERWLNEIAQPAPERRFRSTSELASLLVARNNRLSRDRAEFVARAWTRSRTAMRDDEDVELLFDPRHRRVNPILYRRQEAEACWRRVTCPVLLIAGDASTQARREGANAELMEPHLQRLRRVTLAAVGHMMHHEDPAAVATAISEFLDEHPIEAA